MNSTPVRMYVLERLSCAEGGVVTFVILLTKQTRAGLFRR